MCFAPEPGELYLSVLGCSSFEGEQTRHQEEDQTSAKPAGRPHPDDEDEGEDEQVDNCVQHLHLVQGQGAQCLRRGTFLIVSEMLFSQFV